MREQWEQWETPPGGTGNKLDSSEIGALAHLYRGEVYRSTIWRTRLDNTTNWSVVTLGIALSISFSSPNASPLPLVLVGILILFFMGKPALKALKDYEQQRNAGVTEYTFDPRKLGIKNADFWEQK